MLAALVAASSTAGAASDGSCGRTAAVESGTIVAIDPATGELRERALTGLRRGRTHPYAVSGGPAAVVFQGVRYEIAGGGQFLLECFGEVKGEPARFPRLVLGQGRVKATTANGKTGAVSNGAGMVGPQLRIAMRFVVKAGRYTRLSVTKDARAPGRLTVTPYAGPRKGTCRYVKASAVLDLGSDTARYDGKRAR
jgi:hypothetical protein